MKFNIVHIPEVESTNTHALNLYNAQKLKEGDIIFTYNQLQGRGQAANDWESQKGKNLTVSIVLEPTMINASDQFIITQLVSLSIYDTLFTYLPSIDLKIKWPNDIYYGNNKLGGVLVQNIIAGNDISASIIGIGININQDVFMSDAPNPISLKLITGNEYDIETILDELANAISKNYELMNDIAGSNVFKDSYMSKLYHYNSFSAFKDKDGIFTGKIIDIDEIGRLVIEDNFGIPRSYMFKEVEFIDSGNFGRLL